jgi:hypothetical protein
LALNLIDLTQLLGRVRDRIVGLAEAQLDDSVKRESVEDRGEVDEDEQEEKAPYAAFDTAALGLGLGRGWECDVWVEERVGGKDDRHASRLDLIRSSRLTKQNNLVLAVLHISCTQRCSDDWTLSIRVKISDT